MSTSLPLQRVQRLRDQLRRWENHLSGAGDKVVSSGCAALDRRLPAGGFRSGTIVEWLSGGEGHGAAALALNAARLAMQDGGVLVIIDRRRGWYAPALAGWNVNLRDVVVVYPRSAKEEQWAIVQALGCRGVAAVLASAPRTGSEMLRRWQLAAESGGGLGLLMRPVEVRRQPTWADVQLLVQPQSSRHGRRLQMEILRCRGGTAGSRFELTVDDDTGAMREMAKQHETTSVPLAARLAHPTTTRRTARA